MTKAKMYGQNGIYAGSIAIYALLATSYAINRSETELVVEAGIAIIISIFLIWKDFVSALSLTILVTHIGPVLKATLPVIGMVNLGDIYLGLIVLNSVFRHLMNGVYWGPFRVVASIIFACLLISVPFLPDSVAALPGYLSLLQLVAFYFVVLNEIRTDQDIERLLVGIGWAVIVSASLQLFSYTQGTSLGLSREELHKDIADYQSLTILGGTDESFVKTTFFYASFYGSCTAAMTISVCRILWSKTSRGFLSVCFWSIVFGAAALASLVAGSRTSLLSTAIMMPIAIVMYMRRNQDRIQKSVIVMASTVLVLAILIGAALVILPMLISESQFVFYSGQMFGDVELAISIGERFLMWSEIPEKIIEYPMAFIFGVGPDVPQRSSDNETIKGLMQIRGMQDFQPYSYHNFYIDIILHLGIVSFCLSLIIMVATVIKLTNKELPRPDLTQCLLLAILAWLLLWNTHATGWSKPLLIMSELFALSHLLITRRVDVRGWVTLGK